MKFKLTANNLPLLCAGLGTAALVARLALFLLGQDEKGLLIPGHPLNLLVWGLTAAALILFSAALPGLKGPAGYADNFAPSAAAAGGCFALAAGIALTVLSGWNVWTRLELVRNYCGLAAVPGLVLVGVCRRQGKQPPFGPHALVCLYLTLYAVSHYQLWSSRPQVQYWLFAMAGGILLTLFAYYQTAFDAGMGKRRMQLWTGLLAGFFCITAAAGGEDVALYLGGGAWALTNLCSLTPRRRRRKNPITEREDSDAAA